MNKNIVGVKTVLFVSNIERIATIKDKKENSIVFEFDDTKEIAEFTYNELCRLYSPRILSMILKMQKEQHERLLEFKKNFLANEKNI